MRRLTLRKAANRKSHVSVLFVLMMIALTSCHPPGLAPGTDGSRQASCTLAWDANSESDLAGYRLYYGTESGDYALSIDVGKNLTCKVKGLALDRTYYFAVTAYNTQGIESSFSKEISYCSPPAM